tara:strand:- start:60 stop:206 length:147 start_codon:yes stop_codon:yes gene_type:complete
MILIKVILSTLLQKKSNKTPQSYRADRFDQGFAALATKMPHLRCFWVG